MTHKDQPQGIPKPLGYPKVWPFPTFKGEPFRAVKPFKPAKVRVTPDRVSPTTKPPKPRYTDEAPF